MRAVLPLLVASAVLVACGPPLESKDALAGVLAHAAIPSTEARGDRLDLEPSFALPEAGVTIRGAKGGTAQVLLNPLQLAVGAAGGALLLDIKYSDYSEDGVYRLDGTLSVLARFQYVAEEGEAPYADVKLGLVGKLRLGGAVSDELRMDVTLLTRIHDLEFREDSVELQLDGHVEARAESFVFDHEDLQLRWQTEQP